jgi:hypothetical protein
MAIFALPHLRNVGGPAGKWDDSRLWLEVGGGTRHQIQRSFPVTFRIVGTRNALPFRIRSKDSSGVEAASGDMTFRTP